MAVSKEDVPLIIAMAALARTSPGAWSTFLGEFKNYVDRGKDQVLHTPVGDLVRAQGRIIDRASTLWFLENCKTEADKLRK